VLPLLLLRLYCNLKYEVMLINFNYEVIYRMTNLYTDHVIIVGYKYGLIIIVTLSFNIIILSSPIIQENVVLNRDIYFLALS
jgi:hypothetical protein